MKCPVNMAKICSLVSFGSVYNISIEKFPNLGIDIHSSILITHANIKNILSQAQFH